MRLALSQSIRPERFALGAAAALARLGLPASATRADLSGRLTAIWRAAAPEARESDHVLALIERAWAQMQALSPKNKRQGDAL